MTLNELNATVKAWHSDADAVDPRRIGAIFDALSLNPIQWNHTDHVVLLEMFVDGVGYRTITRERLAHFLDKVRDATTDPHALATWRAVRVALPRPTKGTWIEFFRDLIATDPLQSVHAMALASGKMRAGDELFFGAVIAMLASDQLPADVRFRMQGLVAEYCSDKNSL